MRVSEVLKVASMLIGLDDVATEIDLYEEAREANTEFCFSAGVSEDLTKLINCINLSVERIATSYIRLNKTEAFVSDGEGKIAYEDFASPVVEVVDVFTGAFGGGVNYMVMPFNLYLPEPAKRYFVKYRYLPTKVEVLEDEIELPVFVTARLVAMAVSGDYLLSKNLYDESKFWSDKFDTEMVRVMSGKANKTLRSYKFL